MVFEINGIMPISTYYKVSINFLNILMRVPCLLFLFVYLLLYQAYLITLFVITGLLLYQAYLITLFVITGLLLYQACYVRK